MAQTALITNSTCVIPHDLVSRYKIHVAPQVVIWDGETLEDGIDITPEQFYARLKVSPTMPTTSQATVPSFHKIFKPLVQAGTPIVCILVSSKLSGTIQSAEQAKQEYPGAQIEIVDSAHAGMSLGFQVLQTARKIETGASFTEIAAYARRAVEHVGIMLVVDTLEFLHRGGRIGGAARLLGTALNMKPLLAVRDGRIEPLERVRTRLEGVRPDDGPARGESGRTHECAHRRHARRGRSRRPAAPGPGQDPLRTDGDSDFLGRPGDRRPHRPGHGRHGLFGRPLERETRSEPPASTSDATGVGLASLHEVAPCDSARHGRSGVGEVTPATGWRAFQRRR